MSRGDKVSRLATLNSETFHEPCQISVNYVISRVVAHEVDAYQSRSIPSVFNAVIHDHVYERLINVSMKKLTQIEILLVSDQ